MEQEPHGNRVQDSYVRGSVLQFDDVHGDVFVFLGEAAFPGEAAGARPEGVGLPEDFWSAPDPAVPAGLGLVRVRDTDPLRLGVHRPIRVPGRDEPAPLPAYVTRDLDIRPGDGLRPLVRAAVETGGFVLLVGGSSVGKTRALYEAVRETVPGDWWLLHPSDAGQLRRVADSAPRRLVIWLDELHGHLAAEHGLTAATVRALLTPPCQVLVVGTLWPHYHDAWTASATTTRDEDATRDADRHRVERDVLKLADIIHVAPDLSPAERERAAEAATTDERLRVALDSRDFGLTQVIAGAPQLVHRWENAGPYARALMTAAVDMTLLGARTPLPRDLLRAAAPGYCSPTERAVAPENWFEEALAYATRPLLGATAALSPVSDGHAMGCPDGYRVADYLVQHTGRVQRGVSPPATLWQACADHLTDTSDAERIGRAAVARLRFAAAAPLLRRAVDAGSAWAMRELAELHRRTGDEESAQQVADRLAASEAQDADLCRVLLAGWDFEEVLELAEAGNEYAFGHLIEYGHPQLAIQLLAQRLTPDDLGGWHRLAELLSDEGEDEKAVEIAEMIFRRDDEPDDGLLMFHAELLQHCGRVERLWELADAGYFWAAHYLAVLLHERGDEEQALDVLRPLAGMGHMDLDDLLADYLAQGGHLEELLARAEDGDCRAAVKAASILRSRDRGAEAVALLTPFADKGEVYAASTLAGLWERDGNLNALRERAAKGERQTAGALVRLLLKNGRWDEAIDLARTHGTNSQREIIDCLEKHGEVDRAIRLLTDQADSGESYWTHHLAQLLRKHGREEELRTRVDRGDWGADRELSGLLRERGEEAEADALMRYGLTADGRPQRPRGPRRPAGR